MRDYRAYIIGVDGHFVGAAALSMARKFLVETQHVEVWDGDRLVGRCSAVLLRR
jgi:2-keto-3-deoxy-L-rhamnonate aldolase RhmA